MGTDNAGGIWMSIKDCAMEHYKLCWMSDDILFCHILSLKMAKSETIVDRFQFCSFLFGYVYSTLNKAQGQTLQRMVLVLKWNHDLRMFSCLWAIMSGRGGDNIANVVYHELFDDVNITPRLQHSALSEVEKNKKWGRIYQLKRMT
uniref:Innexin n=1 Tax=Globodera rostochiensis TaxID=31243 RepID=A0A914HZB0_GLORO